MKVIEGGNEVKAKGETTPVVAIGKGKDFEDFETTNNVFNEKALTSEVLVESLLKLS